MAVIDELLVGLGFDYDPKELEQFKKDVSKTTGVIKQLAKAAVAGAVAITGLTAVSTSASDEQGKLADEVGDTVENIDALQFALKRSGGTAEGMANSLRTLAIRAAEAARGVGSGVEAFGLLGISAADQNGNLKKTSDLMLEVSSRFNSFSKSQQIELADKLGIRDSVRLLQQGPSAIRELTDEAKALGVTTSQDAAAAAEFQDSLTDLWQITKAISRTFSRVFAPAIQKVADAISDWWKANRQLIEQQLPIWIERTTTALKLLMLATGAWLAMRLVTHVIALAAVFKGLSVAAMAANAAILFLPALILATVAAIALLAEDAKVFFEGGDSFFGDLFKNFPRLRTVIMSVASVFDAMAKTTMAIFDGWSKIFDMFKNLSLEGFTNFLKNIPGFVGDVTGLVKVEGGGAIPEAAQFAKTIAQVAGNSTGLVRSDGSGYIPEFAQSVSRSITTAIDKVEIVVQGGADTAENIADAVYNVFQQTAQDLNTTVDQ